MILIKNGLVYTRNYFECMDILIENEKIIRMEKNIELNNDCTILIDASNTILTPGFIDMHVHLREPGFSHKETIRSGTISAARGGFTSIAAMPNTKPVIDNTEKLENLKRILKRDAVVKVLPYSSITIDEQGRNLVNFEKMVEEGVIAFSDDGKGVQQKSIMYEAMLQAKKVNRKIVAHCEDKLLTNNGYINEGNLSKQLDIKGITSESEYLQVERDLELVEKTGCSYHVCHISTKESLEKIKNAKNKGLKISCEVTPHHLLLCEDDIDINNANYKMNPPLRGIEDKNALIKGLQDGIIDIIATDHAPHSEEEKTKGFIEAPFGIVGLETCFSLMYTNLVLKDLITLSKLIELLTINPARLFNLDCGEIEVGKIADITLIDLNKKTIINPSKFSSMGKNTPFLNWKCQGVPIMTMVEGKIVYNELGEKHEVN